MKKPIYLSVALFIVVSCFAMVSGSRGDVLTHIANLPHAPVPHQDIEHVIKIAGISSSDVVYELGCGDGRVVIAAAMKKGVSGVGYETDAAKITACIRNAEKASVTDKIRFVQKDPLEADVRGATVVLLYLRPNTNLQLRGRLLQTLAPGTRIVSYRFGMGDWSPTRTVTGKSGGTIYLWIVPANITGTWTWKEGETIFVTDIIQRFQYAAGTAHGVQMDIALRNIRINGDRLHFSIVKDEGTAYFDAVACGNTLRGTITVFKNGKRIVNQWVAQRDPSTVVPLDHLQVALN
jgi:SAM-dependent methyltransferase